MWLSTVPSTTCPSPTGVSDAAGPEDPEALCAAFVTRERVFYLWTWRPRAGSLIAERELEAAVRSIVRWADGGSFVGWWSDNAPAVWVLNGEKSWSPREERNNLILSLRSKCVKDAVVAAHCPGVDMILDLFTRGDFGAEGLWQGAACACPQLLCACAYRFLQGVYLSQPRSDECRWTAHSKPELGWPFRTRVMVDPHSPDLPWRKGAGPPNADGERGQPFG